MDTFWLLNISEYHNALRRSVTLDITSMFYRNEGISAEFLKRLFNQDVNTEVKK